MIQSKFITTTIPIIDKFINNESVEKQSFIAISPTGSGKTIAQAIPVLHYLSFNISPFTCLILVPTRELGFQIKTHVQTIGKPINVKVSMICGGIGEAHQLRDLELLPHIIIATPGRLASFLRDQVSTNENLGYVRTYFGNIKFLILDEADRILEEESTKTDVNFIMEICKNRKFQFLFSATENDFISRLKSKSTQITVNSDTVEFKLPASLKQQQIQVPDDLKDLQLQHFINKNLSQMTQFIVFCNTVKYCEQLHLTFTQLGIKTIQLHSNMKQNQRNRNMQDFRRLKYNVLITTDVSSRGLDLQDIEQVFHLELPQDIQDQVHRSGRTARAGKEGTSVVILGTKEILLLDQIEQKINTKIEEINLDKKDKKSIVDVMHKFTKAKTNAIVEMSDNGFIDKLKDKQELKRKRKEQ